MTTIENLCSAILQLKSALRAAGCKSDPVLAISGEDGLKLKETFRGDERFIGDAGQPVARRGLAGGHVQKATMMGLTVIWHVPGSRLLTEEDVAEMAGTATAERSLFNS